ncbi:MAG: magnesium chelatase subunit D [Betaproteobacteria bacterium]
MTNTVTADAGLRDRMAAAARSSDAADAAAAAEARWSEALLAAALIAVDPVGLGGACVRAGAGPLRERWLDELRRLTAPQPLRRMPLHIHDSRWLGGLDLAATLRAGRPVAERGLLADSDGALLLIPMAERLAPDVAARIAAVMDAGAVRLERDGVALQAPARFGVIALDEGVDDEGAPPAALLDRLALRVDLNGLSLRTADAGVVTPEQVQAARLRLPRVRATDAQLEALCAVAFALGVASLRAPWLALRVACAAAALDERDMLDDDDIRLAARLVLAARATQLPAREDDSAEPPPQQPPPEDSQDRSDSEQDQPLPDGPLEERVLEAAQAAIPPGLLALLMAGFMPRRAQAAGGRSGAARSSPKRGTPAGTRRGEPRAGARLNVVETLRAAAPWQPLRRAERVRTGGARSGARVVVRHDDFRIKRFKQRSQTTTLFAVDASGSSALHRLAEAKGAVELLLAECYVRRDEVALIAFRGPGADLMLPPTRSLVRAKRSLAALPGGGGTPLAAGIDALLLLATAERRRGHTPVTVLLTDGRGNIARDGATGRAAGEADALAAARGFRLAGLSAVLIDTSPRPQPAAAQLAEAMGARYLALPHADARAVSAAVRAATAG